MSIVDRLRYDGKRALVVGGATGMGRRPPSPPPNSAPKSSCLDYAPVDYEVAQSVQVDLRDPASIDAALEQVEGPIHACSRPPGRRRTTDLMKINFIGHRHLIDRLLEKNQLPNGSAICFISSVAGMGWENDLEPMLEFLATPDFAAAEAWSKAHEAEGIIHYGTSKKVINTYVANPGLSRWRRRAFASTRSARARPTPRWPRPMRTCGFSFAQDYRDETGSKVHTPEQMGDVMAFLNSEAACGVSGITMLVDSGHTMASMTGSWAAGKPIIDLIMGKITF